MTKSKKDKKGDINTNQSVNMEEQNSTENINSQEQSNTEQVIETNDVSNESVPEQQVKEDDISVKFAEIQDKYLRLSAEFDNYRRRTLKERMEYTKTAGEDILVKLIPVVDDFERGLKVIDSAKDINAVKEGILLIYNKFKEFLSQKGIKEMESINTDFNSDIHEALTKIPVQDESMKGKVVDEIEKGYYMYDKVIRFAKVVVGE
jgi:molecular chaperone GrpE